MARHGSGGVERFLPQLHDESVQATGRSHVLTRVHIRALAFVAAVFMLTGVAVACDSVSEMHTAGVVAVPDGATIMLDSGDKLRLSGIQAPKLYGPGAALADWPLAAQAQAQLEQLAFGQQISIATPDGAQKDRHQRLLGQAYLADGTWLQQAMLAAGLARAYSFPDNSACAGELLAAEARARADRLGIWDNPFYAVRDAARPDRILDRAGFFELVEGRVLLADKSGATVYLNFGRYWKEDFTVTIDKAAQKRFAAAGFDPLALDGALVRVRGWVEDRDGPRMAVTHPEQIEVLSTP